MSNIEIIKGAIDTQLELKSNHMMARLSVRTGMESLRLSVSNSQEGRLCRVEACKS